MFIKRKTYKVGWRPFGLYILYTILTENKKIFRDFLVIFTPVICGVFHSLSHIPNVTWPCSIPKPTPHSLRRYINNNRGSLPCPTEVAIFNLNRGCSHLRTHTRARIRAGESPPLLLKSYSSHTHARR